MFAIVSPDMKSEFLVSSDDQKKLGLLHPEYPNFNLRQAERDKQKLKEQVEKAKMISEKEEDIDVNEWYFKPDVAEKERKKLKTHPLTRLTTEVEAYLVELEKAESVHIDKLRTATQDKLMKRDSQIDLAAERNKVLDKFPELFTNNLTGKRFINAPPQKITLNPHFTGHPQRRLTARLIPRAWKQEADQMIQDMIKAKLIEKADHHCDWVSSRAPQNCFFFRH